MRPDNLSRHTKKYHLGNHAIDDQAVSDDADKHEERSVNQTSTNGSLPASNGVEGLNQAASTESFNSMIDHDAMLGLDWLDHVDDDIRQYINAMTAEVQYSTDEVMPIADYRSTHQCSTCYKTFVRRDNLRRHRRDYHTSKRMDKIDNDEQSSMTTISWSIESTLTSMSEDEVIHRTYTSEHQTNNSSDPTSSIAREVDLVHEWSFADGWPFDKRLLDHIFPSSTQAPDQDFSNPPPLVAAESTTAQRAVIAKAPTQENSVINKIRRRTSVECPTNATIPEEGNIVANTQVIYPGDEFRGAELDTDSQVSVVDQFDWLSIVIEGSDSDRMLSSDSWYQPFIILPTSDTQIGDP